MRARRLVTLSIAAAASALLLAGCSAAGPQAGGAASPSASAAGDLCAAAAPSGAASEAVTVQGAVGTEPTATFAFPLDVTEVQRTVLTEGSGDPVKPGQLVSYALTAFNAQTGEKLGTVGYTDGDVLPAAVAVDSPLAQVLGCATPGSRIVATFPPSQSGPAEVYVFDLLKTVPDAAWGTPQPPADGFPTVTLDDSGAPTVAVPDTAAPTAFEKATLKKGDGAVVAQGDKVLVQYHGVLWDGGEVFDQSWGKNPFSFTVGSGVVQGFTDAVVGETVGSQVIAVLPPEVAYGAAGQGSIPANATLVFVVDILGVQHATPAAK